MALKKYILKYKWRYIAGLIFLAGVDVLQLIIPKVLGIVTDMLSAGTLTLEKLIRYICIIMVLALAIAGGRFIWRMFIIGSSRKIEYDLRNDLFKHLQSLSTNYFNNHKTGDLMAHATNDINAVRESIGFGVVMATDALVLTAISVFMLFTINVPLAIMSLMPLPFLALVSTKFGKVIHSRFVIVQDAFSKLSDMVQENFTGIRVIKSFVQEKNEIEKFTKRNVYNKNTNRDLVKVASLFFPLVQFISALSLIIVLGYGGTLTMYGDISLGDFVAFNIYLGNLTWPMLALGWVINVFQRGSASMGRISDILKEKPEIFDMPDTIKVNRLKGDIEFRNLTFTYPGANKPSLKNINLRLESGQTLGIVGRTGSGKTTLVNLLLKLFNAENGKIFIDGIDINKMSLSSLRENIGCVPQDSFLFSATVAQNIAFAKDAANMDDVLFSSKVSQVYDNIMEFPDKFDTVVGERGVTLSGGQKQRISIARAVIKDPPVLILDDSLSAVDTKTEENILKELKKITKTRTSIIISHRISSIKDADSIIVMDEGCIIEQGSHEELLSLGGMYSRIYEKQLLEEQLENE